MNNSKSFTKENLIKIAKGAGIAAGGAILTYCADQLPNIDFGVYTGAVVAIMSILINAGREWLKK